MTIDEALAGSAVEAWDRRWATSEGRADWLDPHPAVVALLPELKARGAVRALDLGCGVGRHALFLAEHGIEVEAIDGSDAGLSVLRETAAARGLSLGLQHGSADTLPFPDASFDFVLSWNVIYHGTLGDVGHRLTFVVDGVEEKAHPHFYCDAPGLLALFAGFEPISLAQHQQKKPQSWHWHIVAERRQG